jgi:single-stranded-DNA-specific exonuclease
VRPDCEISIPEITPRLLDQLRLFEPFGLGNPTPQFLLRDMVVKKVETLKGEHLKVIFSQGSKDFICGLWWRCKEHPDLRIGNVVDVVARLDSSTYRGSTELQLTIQAIELAG